MCFLFWPKLFGLLSFMSCRCVWVMHCMSLSSRYGNLDENRSAVAAARNTYSSSSSIRNSVMRSLMRSYSNFQKWRAPIWVYCQKIHSSHLFFLVIEILFMRNSFSFIICRNVGTWKEMLKITFRLYFCLENNQILKFPSILLFFKKL